ncbi:MAG: redox-sensing transcriptional repressor Rex [Candidatus Margulisbacteria bacterium]|nr:redox-sensing transcriptional repressor Rex [Candidatus Margulisiibacteriota bacterium]MBU1617817.1 redox-sensing transcriptional repressor Rex [Candidatus Margulisiibacteriota bacterium]
MVTNKACIVRLSRYKNALSRLKSLGFVKVFSDNLADAADVTPSQVRKDFSIFGVTGNKRGGYVIDELIESLNKILGKNVTQNVVIVGAGRIGTALMQYKGFEKENIRVVAVFDMEPAKQDPKAVIPILPIEQLEPFIKKHHVKIGIIAVPDIAATEVMTAMNNAGIKGVLNFASIRLKGGEETVINNVNLVSELENVIYFVNATEKSRKK